MVSRLPNLTKLARLSWKGTAIVRGLTPAGSTQINDVALVAAFRQARRRYSAKVDALLSSKEIARLHRALDRHSGGGGRA